MRMCNVNRGAVLAVMVCLLSVLTLPAGAQQAPARNANIWNGHDHQPAQDSVQDRERAAGVAMTPQRRAAKDAELDRLSHQLQGGHVHPPASDHPTQDGQAVR